MSKGNTYRENNLSSYAFTNLGITNPTPLKNNLVLEISKKGDPTSLVCSLCFSF